MNQPPAILTPEQYDAALADIERDFKKQITAIHMRYEARMRNEAWGSPAKAALIQAEWDVEVEAALSAGKQRIAALPLTPKKVTE